MASVPVLQVSSRKLQTAARLCRVRPADPPDDLIALNGGIKSHFKAPSPACQLSEIFKKNSLSADNLFMREFLGGDWKWALFSFRGRIKRAPFIFSMIAWPFFLILLFNLPSLVFQIDKPYSLPIASLGLSAGAQVAFIIVVFCLSALFILLPFFALSVKRLNDCSSFGQLLFWLGYLIPGLNLPLFLYLCCAPSKNIPI